MSLRILVTGSRWWTDRDAISCALAAYVGIMSAAEPGAVTLVHGGARGADTIAGEIAQRLGVAVEVHRADWNTHKQAAGPKRNQLMVDRGADVCLAFPIGISKGTRDCIRRAEAAGIPVVITEGAETP